MENRNRRGKPPSSPRQRSRRRGQPRPTKSLPRASPLAPRPRCEHVRKGNRRNRSPSYPKGAKDSYKTQDHLAPKGATRQAMKERQDSRPLRVSQMPCIVQNREKRPSGGTRYFSALEPTSDTLRGYEIAGSDSGKLAEDSAMLAMKRLSTRGIGPRHEASASFLPFDLRWRRCASHFGRVGQALSCSFALISRSHQGRIQAHRRAVSDDHQPVHRRVRCRVESPSIRLAERARVNAMKRLAAGGIVPPSAAPTASFFCLICGGADPHRFSYRL